MIGCHRFHQMHHWHGSEDRAEIADQQHHAQGERKLFRIEVAEKFCDAQKYRARTEAYENAAENHQPQI